eukprot:1943742-Karenia_brevis.AAC.1
MAVKTPKSKAKTVRVDEDGSPTGSGEWQRVLDPEDVPAFKYGIYKGKPYTFVAESSDVEVLTWIGE